MTHEELKTKIGKIANNIKTLIKAKTVSDNGGPYIPGINKIREIPDMDDISFIHHGFNHDIGGHLVSAHKKAPSEDLNDKTGHATFIVSPYSDDEEPHEEAVSNSGIHYGTVTGMKHIGSEGASENFKAQDPNIHQLHPHGMSTGELWNAAEHLHENFHPENKLKEDNTVIHMPKNKPVTGNA